MSHNVMLYGIFPPLKGEEAPFIKEDKISRAWSDFKDHVIIYINGQELGMDIINAIHLYKQLGEAIKKAI